VRDSVREAGFHKPRLEGEANGEWIIVDCGQAVVHIMQPTFRHYYHLEELWGDKPVRLKLGAAKPAVAESAKPVKAAPKAEPSLKRSNAAKKGVQEAFPSKAQVKKTLATKSVAARKPGAKTAPKAANRSVVAKAPVAKVTAKTMVVKPAVKTAAKSAVKPSAKGVSKGAPRKAAPKKSIARKA
jgi:ribosome-associated protein